LKYTIKKQGKGWPLHILLDDKTLAKLSKDGNKRAIATEKISGEQFHCAIIKNKTLGDHIYVNAALSKKLKMIEGSTIDLSFVIDNTELQFNMPEELSELFAQDKVAAKVFNSLTDGNKRGLIHLVNIVKSTDKKIGHALRVAEKLKQGITSPQLVMKKN
jgi:hypothetical protein